MELEQIKRQNRSSKFINDIGIYAIGNLGSKIITFLMVPLYTYFIDKPADYGYYDICLTVVFLLVPFITLQMREGSFRFLLDSRDEANRTKIISFVYRALASTIIISLAVVAIMSLTTGIRYLWYTFALLIFMSLNDVVAQIVRGTWREQRLRCRMYHLIAWHQYFQRCFRGITQDGRRRHIPRQHSRPPHLNSLSRNQGKGDETLLQFQCRLQKNRTRATPLLPTAVAWDYMLVAHVKQRQVVHTTLSGT
jgi:hypothetical protein